MKKPIQLSLQFFSAQFILFLFMDIVTLVVFWEMDKTSEAPKLSFSSLFGSINFHLCLKYTFVATLSFVILIFLGFLRKPALISVFQGILIALIGTLFFYAGLLIGKFRLYETILIVLTHILAWILVINIFKKSK